MNEQMQKFLQRYRASAPRSITDPAPIFNDKKAQFKEYYAASFPLLRSAEKTLRNLVELVIGDLQIDEPKVDSRVKDCDECLRKFELKYRNDVERRGGDYEIRNFISDLIGVRVICLYETDIAYVHDILVANFDVIDKTDKTALLIEDVGTFGYKGVHLDLLLKEGRAAFPEYRRFADLRFEVQIRSIVQDAWSEVDHKLKYKRQIPDTLKRRIIRLAALFELADQEFVSVKNETARLQEVATAARPLAEQHELDDPLDAFSFLSVMQSMYPEYTFDPVKIDGFVDEILSMKRDLTLQEIRNAVQLYGQQIEEYREAVYQAGFSLNPFTAIRHLLYRYSPQLFDDILYPRQRDRFIDWLNNVADRD
jgi:ppGpp synthetase/RelA/SpoT-type nucleotidyltranferase